MFDIITVGDAILDTFLIIDENTKGCHLDKAKKHLMFNYAEKIYFKDTDQAIGGNAANVAVGASRLGLKASIVTELGDDINGIFVRDELKENGVNTDRVKFLKNNQTRYSIVLNYFGERTILSSHVPRKYSLPKLPKTLWLYYTSLGQSFEKLQEKLISHIKKNPEVKLAFNPGSYQLSGGIKKITKVLPQVDILFLNKEEGEKIVGKKGNIRLLIKVLANLGPKIVVITDGENGSYVFGEGKYWRMPIYQTKAIGKAGAGDAYASGFLSAIIHGKSIVDAMCWGTANSAGVVQQIGAQRGLLNKSKTMNLINKNKNIKPEEF